MVTIRLQHLLLVIALAIVASVATSIATRSLTAAPSTQEIPGVPLSSAFTYQGRLDDGAGAVNANCDLSFDLFNDATGGEFLGTSDQSNVPVVNGLFTVALDFGTNHFEGEARWLDVAVRCPTGSAGLFTTLTPRQAITTSSRPWAERSAVSTAAGVSPRANRKPR